MPHIHLTWLQENNNEDNDDYNEDNSNKEKDNDNEDNDNKDKDNEYNDNEDNNNKDNEESDNDDSDNEDSNNEDSNNENLFVIVALLTMTTTSRPQPVNNDQSNTTSVTALVKQSSFKCLDYSFVGFSTTNIERRPLATPVALPLLSTQLRTIGKEISKLGP